MDSIIVANPTTIIAAVLVIGTVGGLVCLLCHRKHEKETRQKIKQTQQKIEKQFHQLVKERIDTLYELTYTLAITLDYQRVLDMVLDIALKTLEQQGQGSKMIGMVMLFDEEGQLEISSSRHLPYADLKKRLDPNKGALERAIKEREIVHLKHPASDPELRKLIAIHSIAEAYLLPLALGLEVYGMVVIGAASPEHFADEQSEILNVLVKQAAIALQNARLYENLQREKQRLAESEEEARKKLARDLHDGPTQTIAAIAMRASYVARLIDKDPEAAKSEIQKIEELARRTTKEIRHMLFTLRPLVLESEGLIAALESIAEKMQQLYGQNVIVQADPRAVQPMDTTRQTIAFYIAEEAINNARKHAEAQHIWVRLRLVRADMALLEIQDDGKGFDIASVGANYERRGSFGMVNMRERASIINGHLEVHSSPGEGTTIRLWIPLNEQAAQRLQSGQLG